MFLDGWQKRHKHRASKKVKFDAKKKMKIYGGFGDKWHKQSLFPNLDETHKKAKSHAFVDVTIK